ncbi:gamma-glutamyltransferase [Shewanella surugensis]|uniref:Glutathione hydrolase proenzyme n=1 Tax=Shewanella surugensis TaxID=212020 RepID=A0ABT0LF84_9GAMM|nr:gamma-glutamyltransferase [Shewanella surugensis]MCL1126371.1 gamma-glutamyltransferase [Shewanella surugensis]
MRSLKTAFFTFFMILPFLALANITPPSATSGPLYTHLATAQPIWAKNGMVASQEALATQAGVDILKQGGNAVDAAVAVAFSLAVTLPRAGNLGGGGFMLVHLAKENKNIAIDYREMAPAQTHRDIFLDENGDPDAKLSRDHGLSVGVPGTVMGMELALTQYGSMSMAQVTRPAINMALNGIIMTPDLAHSLTSAKKRLGRWPSTEAVFYKKDGSHYQIGERFTQPELAHTLSLIAQKGSKGFYQGETAKKIVAAVTKAGGVMTLDDLQEYQAVERAPVEGSYRGYQVVSMPPPSSGGVHIIQMLNILEHFPMDKLGLNTASSIHLMSEAMKRAYADRSEYLGDPDFYNVPVETLTNKAYAKTLASKISFDNVTASNDIKPGDLAPYESNQTTHYSIVDRWGNAVSNTYTLNFSYGSGLIAKGTGVMLNNEMDDFSAKTGVPNGYGLIGGHANAVEPKKRPLSSMSPTIVMKDGEPYIVTGSPGGSRIITTTLQIIMNVIDHHLNIAEATIAPRIHHQWLPDEIRVERSLNPDTIQLLEDQGHKVSIKNTMGSTQSIIMTEHGFTGFSDLRRSGSQTLGY